MTIQPSYVHDDYDNAPVSENDMCYDLIMWQSKDVHFYMHMQMHIWTSRKQNLSSFQLHTWNIAYLLREYPRW